MAHIEIPRHLLSRLDFDRDFDCHLIDVELKDGRVYRGLVIKGDCYISGRSQDVNGEGTLPFSDLDICNIQRHVFAFGRLGAF